MTDCPHTHPTTTHTPPTPAVAASRRWAVACLLTLTLLCLAWELWLAPLRPGGSWIALKALPLALALPGLLRYRLYTYRWLSLLLWLYVAEGAVRAWGDPAPGRWLALTEVLLCLLLFTACAVHVRLRLRTARAALTRQLPVTDKQAAAALEEVAHDPHQPGARCPSGDNPPRRTRSTGP